MANGDGNHRNESRPLLAPARSDTQDSPAAPACRTRCSWPWLYFVVAGIALAVIADVGEDLYAAPRVRLFESVACTQYYLEQDPSLVGPDGSVAERFCKVDPVQSKVSSVLGWQQFFDGIPAILLPIPYGYVADKYGRKWIMLLGLTGYALSFASTLFSVGVLHLPLEYVWLSSLFFLLGGGPTTATTLLTTMVADVVPPESRSTVFFYRFCTDQVADIFVPPIASVLMTRSVWIPLLLAVLFISLCVLLGMCLPETMPWPDTKPCDDAFDQDSSGASTDDTEMTDGPRSDNGKHGSWKSRIQQARDAFAFVTRDRAAAALVFTFLISKVGRQSNNVLFQYASKKYDWTLSQAGLLMSVRASVNIALFTVILPCIVKLTSANVPAPTRDLWIGKASIVLLAVGSLIIFLSGETFIMITGLVVATLGLGFPPIIRSLVTFLVESHHASTTSDTGRLYALISVMEGTGILLAGPGMAWAFQFGMSLGDMWLGLPFGFAAFLFTMVAVVVFRIRI